jgi:SAM-dependent methyltransferase
MGLAHPVFACARPRGAEHVTPEQDAEAADNDRFGLIYANDVWSMHIPRWVEHVLPVFHGHTEPEVLEVGALEGRSAIWMARHVGVRAHVTCVDLFDVGQHERNFRHNIAAAGLQQRVERRVGASEDVICALARRPFDLIYIDADHRASAVLTDAVLCWRILKPGGLLVFDDYPLQLATPYGLDGPKRAIDAFLAINAPNLDVVCKDWQVIVRKLYR